MGYLGALEVLMSEPEIISQIAEERELVRKIAEGNEFVLKRVYKDNYQVIKRMVMQNSGDEDDARDVYQEAFMVFYENCREEGFELKASIGTYLYSIARNLWLKKLRAISRSVEVRVDAEGELVDVEEEVGESENRDQWVNALEGALEGLGEPCRTILVDFFFHKKSMDEIAQKMNYTNAANAKNQKYKCFNRLKKLVLVNKKK